MARTVAGGAMVGFARRLGPAPFELATGAGFLVAGRGFVGRAGAGFFAGGLMNASSVGARFLLPFRTSAARGWAGGSGAREAREPLAVGGTTRVVRVATDFVVAFVGRGIVMVYLGWIGNAGCRSDGNWF